MLTLYSFWRSSAAYRVRIALNFKGLEYETRAVHLVKDGGEQHAQAYRQTNPQGLVPTLVDDGLVLGQSLAIIEYLDEKYPVPSLLPAAAEARAKARQIAFAIAADIHPLCNLRVLQFLDGVTGAPDGVRDEWYRHWVATGLAAVEPLIDSTGPFAMGDQVTLADLCVVPQIYNAHRYSVSLASTPMLARVEGACLKLEAFAAAAPEQQPDAD
jgi:maleylacetoacetate isomerase